MASAEPTDDEELDNALLVSEVEETPDKDFTPRLRTFTKYSPI
jgi:hypothetical protein